MTPFSLISILAAGFSLGLIHALDPDHLMTISSLAANERGRAATAKFAAHWALGHGALLTLVVAAVVGLGWTLPPALSAGAERMVGIVLIVTGACALWLRHPPHASRQSLRRRAPFAIGLIHGMAGSAAMLGLIPVTLYHPALGLAYVWVFSFGVLASMLAFAFAVDYGKRLIASRLPSLGARFRAVVGISSIGMGLYWFQIA